MMENEVKTLGLAPDALMLLQQIDQKHLQENLINNVNLDSTVKNELERNAEEKKVTQSMTSLVKAFKFFFDEGYITQAEYDFVSTMSDSMTSSVAMLRADIPPLINKVLLGAKLMEGNPPPMMRIGNVLSPKGVTYPLSPEDFAVISNNLLSALKEELPGKTDEFISHLYAVMQAPINGGLTQPPSPGEPGQPGQMPGFSGPGTAATSVGGYVKSLTKTVASGTVSYDITHALYPPNNRGDKPMIYLVVKTGVNIDLDSIKNAGKWVDFEGVFVVHSSPPQAGGHFEPPVFQISKLIEKSDAPVTDPRDRTMRFSGVFQKNAANSKYYIGNSTDANARIIVDVSGITDFAKYIGKLVTVAAVVTKWSSGYEVPLEIKASGIEPNTSFVAP